VIGPAEIEDLLSDLSEALANAKGAPLDRTPVWPVPAGTVPGERARKAERPSTVSRLPERSDTDEHGSGA
jgi:hypothetical protein